jgi:hypothetical protein
MTNEFDWIAINNTLDGHFSSILMKDKLMKDKFRLTSAEFMESYSGFFEEFAKDDEFETLKRDIKENIVKLAPNDLKNSVQGYREAIGRTTEIGKLKDLIKQVESDYGLTKGEILNKYKGRMNTGNTVNPVNPAKFSKKQEDEFDKTMRLIRANLQVKASLQGRKATDKKVGEYIAKLRDIHLQNPESIKTLTPLLKEIHKELGFKPNEFLPFALEDTAKFTKNSENPVNKVNSNKGRMNTGNTDNNPYFTKDELMADKEMNFKYLIFRIGTYLTALPQSSGDPRSDAYKKRLEKINWKDPKSINTLTSLLKEISNEFNFEPSEFLEKFLPLNPQFLEKIITPNPQFTTNHVNLPNPTKKFTGNPVNKVNSNKGRNVTRRKASPTSMNDIRKQMAEMNELSNQMTKIRVRSNLEV